MALYFVPKPSVEGLIRALSTTRDVVAPVTEDGTVYYVNVTTSGGAADVDLEANLSVVPPKDAFFPQTQTLMRFRTGPKLEITREPGAGPRPVALLGVRPCDARSFSLLDKIFTQGQFVDAPYIERRANTTVVAMGCAKAWNTCFCTSVGASPAESPWADALMFPLDGGYSLETTTPKGELLVASLSEAGMKLAELTSAQAEALAAAKTKALESVSLTVDATGIDKALEKLFESEMWPEMAEKCIGCGVCTFVCPTCHCFDMQDEVEGDGGKRIRCWDSCMFSDFTRMAGGHNPRPAKRERTRQRFMHKLRYGVENQGEVLCVGCGRCLRRCPGGMDITEVIEEAKALEC